MNQAMFSRNAAIDYETWKKPASTGSAEMEPKSLKPALAEFDRLYVEPASGRPLDQRELAHIIITAICTAIDTGKVEPIE